LRDIAIEDDLRIGKLLRPYLRERKIAKLRRSDRNIAYRVTRRAHLPYRVHRSRIGPHIFEVRLEVERAALEQEAVHTHEEDAAGLEAPAPFRDCSPVVVVSDLPRLEDVSVQR